MYRDPIGHRIKTINNLMRKTMDKKTGQRPDRVTLMHCWIIGFVQDREDSGLDRKRIFNQSFYDIRNIETDV